MKILIASLIFIVSSFAADIKAIEEDEPVVIPAPAPAAVEPVTPAAETLGEFKITVYTPESDGGCWGYQTATGVKSEHLATCAVDPNIIPLGSIIKVGDLTLTAVDTGSAVKGNVIDVFYDGSSEKASDWVNSFGALHTVEGVNKNGMD